MNIISIRENKNYMNIAIEYFQKYWATENTMMIYEDCISHAVSSENPLPQWYLLEKENKIIGCVGLITNDFISRMDLYPWLCALYIEEAYRRNGYGKLLIEKIKLDAKRLGFFDLYLCTDHVGYYENYGF